MKDRPTPPLYMETAIRLHTRILVCSGEDYSHKSDKGRGKKQRVSWVLEALAGSVQSAGFQVQREAREQTRVTHSLR